MRAARLAPSCLPHSLAHPKIPCLYCSGDGKMSRDEMFNVLTSVAKQTTGQAEATVSDDLLESVMKYAANQSDGEVHPEHLLMAIKRYKCMLAENEQLAELFKKHDADASGSMDKGELLGLLREVAPPPHKYADEADAEFILEKCNTNDNDTIEWEELKPAIATWMELAKEVPKPEQKSSACVLL